MEANPTVDVSDSGGESVEEKKTKKKKKHRKKKGSKDRRALKLPKDLITNDRGEIVTLKEYTY
jgi:hypothetical protein